MFKSSKGKDKIGKRTEVSSSSQVGQGIGGAGGSTAPVPISASGGTKTVFADYTIHEFKTPGTFSIDSGEGHINLLLVAGGQGGAPNRGGGGGGGGTLHRCNIEVDPTTSPFAVSIGAGGGSNSNGGNSTFGPTFTAYGGACGRGGYGSDPVAVGSRGGAGVPAPLLPQGNSGAPGSDPQGGGGGGAGSAGNGKNGGSGITIPQIPTAYGDSGFFAGGGGGGNNGTNSTAFTKGGNGGKGVVILSMPDAAYSGTTTGSPTVATGVSGKTVLTFTGDGSYTT